MRGWAAAAFLTTLLAAAPAVAASDVFRYETHTSIGREDVDLTVQVSCGGPLGGFGAEVYQRDTRVTPAATGTAERGSGRAALGDAVADGALDEGDYGACLPPHGP